MRTASSSLKWLAGVALVAVAAGGLAGCRTVQPWEREVLSLRCMSGDGEGAEDKFRQHWQESREGGSGGFSHSGGGCGCN